jgi:tight adherence protein B
MNEWLLILVVFGFVATIALGVSGIVGGGGARRLRSRLQALAVDHEEVEQSISAIRARYLRQLSPFERRLEELPGMELIGHMAEQAGWTIPAYRVVMFSVGLAAVAGIAGSLFLRQPIGITLVTVLAGASPILKLRSDRGKRLEKFETQLPDALDLMSRSLRAGNPLLESFKFVSEEMKPPISVDFGRAWSNINYGVSLKASLVDFMERTPSISLRSLATAILVQRETGGNLAEILDKITHVLRARARFQRRLKTLTAEGRMSGWVLGSIPFALGGLLMISSPGYLDALFKDPAGLKLVWYSLSLMAVGIFWITRVVKVRV